MAGNNTYTREEKLKSRKTLNALFTSGNSFLHFPVKVFYRPADDVDLPVLQTGVGVSARNFKKAADRNRVKRLLRECYRLNKQELAEALKKADKKASVFFLYIGKELPEYGFLEEKIKQSLTKLKNQIVR